MMVHSDDTTFTLGAMVHSRRFYALTVSTLLSEFLSDYLHFLRLKWAHSTFFNFYDLFSILLRDTYKSFFMLLISVTLTLFKLFIFWVSRIIFKFFTGSIALELLHRERVTVLRIDGVRGIILILGILFIEVAELFLTFCILEALLGHSWLELLIEIDISRYIHRDSIFDIHGTHTLAD